MMMASPFDVLSDSLRSERNFHAILRKTVLWLIEGAIALMMAVVALMVILAAVTFALL